LLFVVVVQSVFDVAYQNVVTAQKQQINVLHEAIIAQLNAGVRREDALRVVSDIETVTNARIVTEADGNRTIVASTDPTELGQNDGASLLFSTSAATPGSAYIYEFTENSARVWHAYQAVKLPNEVVFIITEHSFKTVDATMAARQQLVFLGLSAIFIFLLAVAYWLSKQKNWAAAYQQLQKKQQEQILFTNTIVHELRAPLTVVKGYASLLQESETLTPPQREHVRTITLSTDRLIVLINDFLEVARIQSGQLRITKQAVDVVPLIQNCLATFAAEAKKKQLSLTVTGVTSASLSTDSARFTQVITNLISNAIKYTDAGAITVEVSQTKRETVIKVKDTGHGISAEDQTRLFTAFTRVGNADKSTVTGSGLGMWITKQIVLLLGGDISIESIESVGTVVKLRFAA
jgi:signal transduction histidine kinase